MELELKMKEAKHFSEIKLRAKGKAIRRLKCSECEKRSAPPELSCIVCRVTESSAFRIQAVYNFTEGRTKKIRCMKCLLP